MKRLVVPKFETEAEEAQWWYDHRDVLDENFIEAVQAGTAHRGGPAALLRETQVIQLRIANTDLARVEKLAEEKGLGNQACINMLIREALDRHEADQRKSA